MICKLHNVLYVLKLLCNQLNVAKITEKEKLTRYESGCETLDENLMLIADAHTVGNLHYLNCQGCHENVNTASTGVNQGSKGSKGTL